ncbi:MAG: hypothetical protein KKC55_14045 [Gammaproteobacteria bacterium]|jgi:hypothetical protein|uniref:Uncharacterized protein n=1 Tax=viral metagenome TaxID=1070528 RepID=A0A6M3M5C0_9ZZZZ|nr:hypothetical protein [Gammaproteobacteria bacterium]|tara:strand:- start:345 stop:563 length:219 start_codon:yes stop_codon:yes gene_type:complete
MSRDNKPSDPISKHLPFKLIKGGAEIDAICHELLMGAISPEMDGEKVARLEALLKPKGKLSLVDKAIPDTFS